MPADTTGIPEQFVLHELQLQIELTLTSLFYFLQKILGRKPMRMRASEINERALVRFVSIFPRQESRSSIARASRSRQMGSAVAALGYSPRHL